MFNIIKIMKKIAFIVDTSSNIKNGELKDVYVLPLTINVTNKKTNETKSYHDGVDITINDVAKYLNQKDFIVTTAGAATGDIMNLVEKINDKYDEIYALPIPKYLSGSANTWEIVAKEYDKLTVGVENKEVVCPVKWTVAELQEMAKNNTLNPKTFKEYITKVADSFASVLFVSDITQLVKGGRVSNFKSLLIKMLKLKIVITCDKNDLKFFKTSKDLSKGFNLVADEYKKRISGFSLDKLKKICILFGSSNENEPEIIELVKHIKKSIPSACEIIYGQIPNVILAHTGDKALIVAFEI